MEITIHRSFIKDFKIIPKPIREHFLTRRKMFCEDPFYPLLHNHALSGKYEGYRSINITGDYRALYYVVSKTQCMFVRIGTHAELYE